VDTFHYRKRRRDKVKKWEWGRGEWGKRSNVCGFKFYGVTGGVEKDGTNGKEIRLWKGFTKLTDLGKGGAGRNRRK